MNHNHRPCNAQEQCQASSDPDFWTPDYVSQPDEEEKNGNWGKDQDAYFDQVRQIWHNCMEGIHQGRRKISYEIMQRWQGEERESGKKDGGESQEILVDKTPHRRLARENDRAVYPNHLAFCPYHLVGI